MSDPVYVCIAAVRIQQWISRTPRLVLNRGASRALAEKTGSNHFRELLAGSGLSGAHLADDAPDVDGVVVLRVDDESGTTADAVIEWLRRAVSDALPGVEWKAWAHQGPSYARAKAASDKELASHGTWHFAPVELDVPFARACEGCRHEYGVELVHFPGEPNAALLGPDCLDRLRFSKQLEAQGLTFDQLARHGGVAKEKCGPQTVGRRSANNHLATIAADGNRVGSVFEHLAHAPSGVFTYEHVETTVQAALSKLLDRATRDAVARAGGVGEAGAELPSAIVHFVGGDDVLASVGARFAWEYVTKLLTEFDGVFKSGLADVTGAAQAAGALTDTEAARIITLGDGVSLGVGIAFANRSHPFADCADMAHRALSRAKLSGRGAPAVSWVDLTVESSVPADRYIGPHQLTAPATAAMTPSARATLEALIRDRWTAALSAPGVRRRDSDHSTELWAMVKRWCERTDNSGVLPTDEPAEGGTADALIALRSDLDRARWWPAQERSGR